MLAERKKCPRFFANIIFTIEIIRLGIIIIYQNLKDTGIKIPLQLNAEPNKLFYTTSCAILFKSYS